MKKLRFGGGLQWLCLFPAAACASCLCTISNKNNLNGDTAVSIEEKKPLIMADQAKKTGSSLKLKDVIAGSPTLAFHLKPKMVVLRVSMHCGGCARKVEKHISKLEGVSTYQVDLESKMVVVTGDIVPFDVLESVSKVKFAELWDDES